MSKTIEQERHEQTLAKFDELIAHVHACGIQIARLEGRLSEASRKLDDIKVALDRIKPVATP